MIGHQSRLVTLALGASLLSGSDVGAHPIEEPRVRVVPIDTVEVLPPRNVGVLRPPAPACLRGSRWYGPYGYICYRPEAAR